MNVYATRAHAWIDGQSARQKQEIQRAPKGVPTYVGVVTISVVVACIQFNIVAGVLAAILGWMLLAYFLRTHSDVINECAWPMEIKSTKVGYPSRLRDRLPRWLTRPPAAPTLIAPFIGLLWVMVFFRNDISTRAQNYSALAFTSESYQDALALTEPNVFGFVSPQPCYYADFSHLYWLFRVGPVEEVCYVAASFLDPNLTPKALLLAACTFLVVPTWWRVVLINATRNSKHGSEKTN